VSVLSHKTSYQERNKEAKSKNRASNKHLQSKKMHKIAIDDYYSTFTHFNKYTRKLVISKNLPLTFSNETLTEMSNAGEFHWYPSLIAIWLNKQTGSAFKVQSKPFIVIELAGQVTAAALSLLNLPTFSTFYSFGTTRLHFRVDISNVPGINDYGSTARDVRSKYRTGLRYQILTSIKDKIAQQLLDAGLPVKTPMEDRITITPEEINFLNVFWKAKEAPLLSSFLGGEVDSDYAENPKVAKFVDNLITFLQQPAALLEILKWHGDLLTVSPEGVKKAIKVLIRHKQDMKQAMSANFHLLSFLATKKNNVGLGVEFLAKHFFSYMDLTTACHIRPIIAYALSLKLHERYLCKKTTDSFQYHLRTTGSFSSAWLKAYWYESKVLKITTPLSPGNGNTFEYIKRTAPLLLQRLDPASVSEIMKEQIDFSNANDKTTRKAEIDSYLQKIATRKKKNVQNLR
jgi:hypothetical protein